MLTVTKFNDGTLIRPSKTNELWGSIMLISITQELKNGAIFTNKRIGFIRAELTMLESFNLTDGDDFNKKQPLMAAKIVVKESLTPFFEGQECKAYPANHDKAGQPITTVTGDPIYRDTVVVAIESDEKDVYVSSHAVEATATPQVGDLANAV